MAIYISRPCSGWVLLVLLQLSNRDGCAPNLELSPRIPRLTRKLSHYWERTAWLCRPRRFSCIEHQLSRALVPSTGSHHLGQTHDSFTPTSPRSEEHRCLIGTEFLVPGVRRHCVSQSHALSRAIPSRCSVRPDRLYSVSLPPLFPCAYMLSTCATKLKNTTIFCRPTYRGGSARHDCDSAYSHVNLEPCPTSIRLFRFVCCAAAGSLTSPINRYLELPWSFGRLFPRRSDPNTSRQ